MTKSSFSRSKLYRLTPEGTNGGLSESLVSYLTRLSAAHSVHPITLLKAIAQSTITKDYLLNDIKNGAGRFFQRAKTLNGVGELTLDIINKLSNLNSVDNLERLSLIPWREAIVNKYLFKPSKAWCSQCFSEWKNSKSVLYEPLIWSLKDAVLCPVHMRELTVKCPNPNCTHPISQISATAIIGYCPSCHIFLGSPTKKESKVPLSDWDVWATRTLFNLIELTSSGVHLTVGRNSVKNSFQHLLLLNGGNVTAFANEINLHRSVVWQYCNGKFLPPLNTILNICFKKEISFIHFLTGNTAHITVTENNSGYFPEYSHKLQQKKISNNIVSVQKKIQMLMNINPPLGLTEVARRLNISPKTINRHFPNLSEEIKTRFQKYRAIKKQENFARTCNDIKQCVFEITKTHAFPYQARVEKYLNRPGLLRRPTYNAVWRNAIEEFYLDV